MTIFSSNILCLLDYWLGYSRTVMQNKIYRLERAQERRVLFKLKYQIMKYNQLFFYLYTILSSVARLL